MNQHLVTISMMQLVARSQEACHNLVGGHFSRTLGPFFEVEGNSKKIMGNYARHRRQVYETEFAHVIVLLSATFRIYV